MNNKIYPFHLSAPSGKRDTPFVSTVVAVLEENLQKADSFGCTIHDCHTVVGSKKHLHKFIEAELLFHNSYYNKGFAFLTTKYITDKLGNNFDTPIVLVGYETFSELCICETIGFLNAKGYNDTTYYIVETQSKDLEVRPPVNNVVYNPQVLYVFIVPICTTLTTFDKLISVFQKEIFKSKVAEEFKETLNIGFILIAPQDEKNDFLKEKGKDEKKVYLKADKVKKLQGLNDKAVQYFVWVASEWDDIPKCSSCFPDLSGKSLTSEKAKFEVNRASVVPMLQLGIEYIPTPIEENLKNDEVENIIKIMILNSCLIQRHIVRGDNHYQYYFDTQKFFREVTSDRIDKELGIKYWLEHVVKSKLSHDISNEILIFDFIVAPRHFSNAGFVQLVNDVVFQGGARVLYFDVMREYRGNIKAKYSDLTKLIENTILSGQKVKINFHFVDDTILLGTNYLRTKNFLNTLIPIEESEFCEKSLFESVIVLVGRNSIDSKKWYISNVNKFYEYVHVSISPMRTHENACLLCAMVSDYNQIEFKSATNLMACESKKTIIRHSIVNKDESLNALINSSEMRENGEKQAMVLISHLLSVRLSNKWWPSKNAISISRESIDDVYEVILYFYEKLYKDLKRNEFKIFDKRTCNMFKSDRFSEQIFKIALIKVISRPFFTYHIRQKQASFAFCLSTIDRILHGDKDSSEDKILLALINALADMDAMYLVRKEVMDRINQYFESLESEKRNRIFLSYYKAIKKMITISGDDNKGVLLESILVLNTESYFFDSNIKHSIHQLKIEKGLALYLENNNVLYKGFEDITKNNLTDINDANIPYYLEGFWNILRINNISNEYNTLITKYARIQDCIKRDIPDLSDFAENVNDLFGEKIEVITFLMDKNNYIDTDKFYPLNNKSPKSFYLNNNIFKLQQVLKEGVSVLNTVYYLEEKDSTDSKAIAGKLKYIVHIYDISREAISKENNKSFLEVDEGRVEEIYFTFEIDLKECNIQYGYFYLKVLLLFRNEIVKMLKRINIQYEISKLEMERTKKALEIDKAHTHSISEFYWGADIVFDRNQEHRERYLLLLTNDFIVEQYRKNILHTNGIIIKQTRLKDFLRNWLTRAGFDEKGSVFKRCIIAPNILYEEKMVMIECNVNEFDNKKFCYRGRAGNSVNSFIYFMYVFVLNAALHYKGSKDSICLLSVRTEGEYIVYENNFVDKSNGDITDSEKNEIVKNACEKMWVPPWIYPKREQNITLWTINRYFQILINDITKQERGKAAHESGYMKVSIEGDKFIVRLRLLKEVENERN